MNRLKQVLTLLLLANWFACIAHCQLELSLGEGHPILRAQTGFQAPSPASEGADDHICDWVVTGGYKISESRVAAPDWVASLLPDFHPPLSPQAPPPLPLVHFAEWSTPPPVRADSFLLVCRTALPVRAPAFII